MYIDEIEEGSKVNIIVHIGTDTIEFETEAIAIDKKMLSKLGIYERILPVKLIKKDEKTVGFRSGVVYRVICMHQEMPYLWTDLSIKLVNIPEMEDKIHIIASNQDAKKYNRRSCFRQWLGLSAVVQINANKKAIDVTVKDISSKGVSFIIRKEMGEPHRGDMVHMVFNDEAAGARFSLVAIVNWCKELDEKRYLAGCVLKTSSDAIEKYISTKQREKMKTGGRAASLDKLANEN